MNPPRRQLIQNAIRVPLKDGTCHYLNSRHVHDFVSFGRYDKPNYVMTDGGLDYIHRGGNPKLYEEWDLYSDSAPLIIMTRLLWGTRGPKGDQPLKWLPIWELSLDHLKAIKATQPQIVGKLHGKVVDNVIRIRELV